MRVTLVGSDCEENLGLAMIAAALTQARHRVDVIPFNEFSELEEVAGQIVKRRPQVVGLGIQFQHRSSDFLLLARRLRQLGYKGHVTCGGQHPTMAWLEILEFESAIDSIVLHEGERSIVELCAALNRQGDITQIPGLALRTRGGSFSRTAPRALCDNLDELPFATRYREPARHLGLAFRPVWGSRGCWGSCAFCSITTHYRDARAYGGGRTVRLRSTDSIAAEMAALWHAEGATTLFCFHDETLLLPRPADSINRLKDLRRKLDDLGVGQLGIIGKCRPDCVTSELAVELRRLGVIRMFVGVENGSQRGLDHLGRRTTLDDIERALTAFEAAGIFVCYNLLLFEPDTLLGDVRENIEFMRRHAHLPVNFCRAEPYHGTPLYHRVKERGSILGSYLGWDYRIADDRTELAFRIAAAAFRERNFDAEGVANRTMGLGYTTQLLRCYYDVRSALGQRLLDRSADLIREIVQDSADLLERAVNIAERADLSNHDWITRETARLGLRIAAHNRLFLAALDDLTSDMGRFVAEQPRTRAGLTIPDRVQAMIERMALAGCFVASLQACSGDVSNDQVPPGGGASHTGGVSPSGSGVGGQVVDMVPVSGGRFSTGGTATAGTGGRFIGNDGGSPPVTGGSKNTGGIYADPLPITGGRANTGGTTSTGGLYFDTATGGTTYGGNKGVGGGDPVPGSGGLAGASGSNTGGKSFGTGGFGVGGMVVNALPPSGGMSSTGSTTGGGTSTGGANPTSSSLTLNVNQPASDSQAACIVDPAPPDAGNTARTQAVVENWRDSSPKHVVRSLDLPLFDPPDVSLESKVDGTRVSVMLRSDEPNLSLRWECEGNVSGDGREVQWQPASEDDALCVAARGPGGIAVATLRARNVLTG